MYKVLADSDFLVALARDTDPNHKKAIDLLKKAAKEKFEIVVTNLIKQESATVISHRVGMEAVHTFIAKLEDEIQTWIWFDESLEIDAWHIFFQQTKKGTSFVDCANLAVIEKYKFVGILSFDRFYGDKLVG